jgi:hypothetical protein
MRKNYTIRCIKGHIALVEMGDLLFSDCVEHDEDPTLHDHMVVESGDCPVCREKQMMNYMMEPDWPHDLNVMDDVLAEPEEDGMDVDTSAIWWDDIDCW